MSRVLVIGCGGVASVAIRKCCQVSEVFTELCIASRTKEKCDALVEKLQGTTGTKLIFDQVFFYNDGSEATSIDAVTPATPNTIANNLTYTLSGIEVKGDNLPKGIYIRNGRKFIVR